MKLDYNLVLNFYLEIFAKRKLRIVAVIYDFKGYSFTMLFSYNMIEMVCVMEAGRQRKIKRVYKIILPLVYVYSFLLDIPWLRKKHSFRNLKNVFKFTL